MDERGKSDSPIVPGNPPNKAGEPAAEAGEGRGLTEGNADRRDALRTQSRESALSALERIRQIAQRDRKARFTALLHHVYDPACLTRAYMGLEPQAAAGVDGETWKEYGRDRDRRIRDLSERLKRGAYRAKPVRRAYIPKADGRQRPLGVPTLEDKIVQRAVVEVLNAVYEADFLGFSYGFRPRRNAHDALDALAVGIGRRRVNWVLDADIRGFFDTLDHGWLVKFIEHRIADRRVVRLIQKWLAAGVLEDGKRIQSEVGTVQGGSISPLLANVYLHYALDLWTQHWRKTRAHGDMVIVRYADDFVMGFEHREEAERFEADLRERFRRFGLELHPEKTRLIEFGRFAAERRRKRQKGRPPTFSFLGFTHICGQTRNGEFALIRQTMRQRMGAKLNEVKAELRRRMHAPVPEVGQWLRTVLTGHYRYYGVPRNYPALKAFRSAVFHHWMRALRHRSQTPCMTAGRQTRLSRRWLPDPWIAHPYPETRLAWYLM